MLMGGLAMAQRLHKGDRREVTPQERAERMTERMAKEYALNDEQKKELLSANKALAEKGDREKMRQEFKASREAYEAQLKKIMTEDQYAAYAKKQAERQKRMSERRQRK